MQESVSDGFFDYSDLDRMDAYALSGMSAIRMKAQAMRFRHNALGYKFSRNKTMSRCTLAESLVTRDEEEDGGDEDCDEDVIDIEGPDNIVGLKAIFLHPFCILIACVPLGMLSQSMHWGDKMTFWLNFLALVPLAKILGDATEELAASLHNDTLSGLLNATFGNAVELIVSVQSIRAGLYDVVKSSLLGSVLSNILLVLGSAFLLGGLTMSRQKRGPYHSFIGDNWKRRAIGLEKEQKFPIKSALISMAMLFFACMVVVLPTLFNALPTDDSRQVLAVSRIGAWITMGVYVLFLIFQLLTHSATLAIEEKMQQSTRQLDKKQESVMSASSMWDDEEGGPSLDLWVAVTLMCVTTVVVALCSDYLVETIKHVVSGSSIPMSFIGVILLPLAGNACEHASAIRFSMVDRPGLAIGIAVGSSTQIALLCIPLSVLIAQFMDKPLDLDFGILNIAVLSFSVMVVFVLLLDGRSNWFKGAVLMAMYLFIATLYLYIPPDFH